MAAPTPSNPSPRPAPPPNPVLMTATTGFAHPAEFIRESARGRLTLWRRGEDSPALRACLADPEAALARANLVKQTRSTTAGILRLDDGHEVFIKRHNNRGVRYTMRHLFARARPFRAWNAAWICEQHGIPTPRPLAAMAERRVGLLREAWLVTRAVPAPVPTLIYVEQLLRHPHLYDSFTAQVAAMLARMHAAGIRHGDPKLSNIYACHQDDGFHYGVWDLDGARLADGPVHHGTRVAEAARVVSSLVEISIRLGQPLPLEPWLDKFLAAYADVSRATLKRPSVLDATWRHLRRMKRNARTFSS